MLRSETEIKEPGRTIAVRPSGLKYKRYSHGFCNVRDRLPGRNTEPCAAQFAKALQRARNAWVSAHTCECSDAFWLDKHQGKASAWGNSRQPSRGPSQTAV